MNINKNSKELGAELTYLADLNLTRKYLEHEYQEEINSINECIDYLEELELEELENNTNKTPDLENKIQLKYLELENINSKFYKYDNKIMGHENKIIEFCKKEFKNKTLNSEFWNTLKNNVVQRELFFNRLNELYNIKGEF